MSTYPFIYFLLYLAASTLPHSEGYMIPYVVMWKNGLTDVEANNDAMSPIPPPRQATWPTPTMPQEEIKATTSTPGLTDTYSVLVVVMMALALCILWNIGALVRMMHRTMSTLLSVFTKSQRIAEEREQDLKENRRSMEERIASLEAENASLNGATSSREAVIASLTPEVNLLKGQLAAVSSEASDIRGQLVEARVKADQATEALVVERQSRLRAETREEDERRERICTTANARRMNTAYRQEIEELRTLRAKQEAESELRIENLMKEKDRLKEAIVVAEEHERALEAKVQSLMASPEDVQTNSEQLEDLSRAKDEIKVMHHRLEAVTREKASLVEEASLKISELERKVTEGGAQRRLMHNTILEVRGNVPVFARVRPFLPSDNVHDDAEPVVISTADGEGCILSKHVVDNGKDYGHFTHSFKFDKCFPPSAGQEEVFTEVSEFVQSALDGFNVCLFSYGSDGSGKTHTMQGSGAGSMRGIIPRAMEQVGKYKEKLEEQGWQYQMEVSFLEIYNEQIRDLLRGDSCGQDIKHEIKRDNRGNTSVTEITKEPVDPNDSTLINDIIQRAACRRSVARTDMNEHSSRSHSVFTLYLKGINNSQRSRLRGTLHLVDLAGSERVGRSNAKGDRLNETRAINTSLSALAGVFVAIANKSSHIPFRISKLTYLLQPALSGDGKTLMMVNLSPTEETFRETLCSLRFAKQVKQCELGKPKRNLHDTGSS